MDTKDIIKDRHFKSCLEEIEEPVTGTIYGDLPEWLKGTLLRNGPGLYDIGQDQYHLFFDGMAMFHKFCIKDGVVTYRNKFLQSDAYTKNMAANRIVISEAGTLKHPDPCKNIFKRFFSWFMDDDETDNCNVNFANIGDGIYAITETSKLHRIDPESLESIDKIRLRDYVSVYTSTAHPQRDADGNVYNFGQSVTTKGLSYSLLKFPPEKGKEAFRNATIVTQIPSRWRMNLGYFHSFGLTDRYIIFAEQSLQISLIQVLKSGILKSCPAANSLKYNDLEPVRFFVIDKKSGTVSDSIYMAAPFFFFHAINAFEDGDHLVFDVACCNNGKVFESIERFSKMSIEEYRRKVPGSTIRRFVLPLSTKTDVDKDMVNLDYTGAKARYQPDGTIFCDPEVMDTKGYTFELPQINPSYCRQKYRYTYGISYNNENKTEFPTINELMKFDFKSREFQLWSRQGFLPSEPIFIAQPNSVEEDEGVILSAVYSLERENCVYLLVLDAKSFEEMAWVEFDTVSTVPICIHGMFLK
ncbi:Retinoid isomerohydrolase [Nymphon striatum]|nr:Retinoid isomerohydrolase [Nymphon striatum]